jgi:hypothetical protein
MHDNRDALHKEIQECAEMLANVIGDMSPRAVGAQAAIHLSEKLCLLVKRL